MAAFIENSDLGLVAVIDERLRHEEELLDPPRLRRCRRHVRGNPAPATIVSALPSQVGALVEMALSR